MAIELAAVDPDEELDAMARATLADFVNNGSQLTRSEPHEFAPGAIVVCEFRLTVVRSGRWAGKRNWLLNGRRIGDNALRWKLRAAAQE